MKGVWSIKFKPMAQSLLKIFATVIPLNHSITLCGLEAQAPREAKTHHSLPPIIHINNMYENHMQVSCIGAVLAVTYKQSRS